MTILVTGAGLIGSEAAALLAGRGDRVILCDLRQPASLPPGDVRFVECSVTDLAGLQRIVEEHAVSKIVHLAAVLSTGMRADPLNGLHVNVCGTANVLELARRHRIARVVYASSSTLLYAGFASLGPQPIDEDAPLRLVTERQASLYAISKQAGEQLCLHYRDHYGVSTVSLRFGAVLGGDPERPSSVPGRLLATLARGAASGELVLLDDPILCWAGTEEFVDARDCARAVCHALDATGAPLGVYNVVNPAQYSLEEFIDAVRAVAGDFPVRIAQPVDTGFAGFAHVRPAPTSVEAARRELGFACRYELQDSIRFWTARR